MCWAPALSTKEASSSAPASATDVTTSPSLAWPGSPQPGTLGLIWFFLFLRGQVHSSGSPQRDPGRPRPGAPAEGPAGGQGRHQRHQGPEAPRRDRRCLVHPHHHWHLRGGLPLPAGQQHPQKERQVLGRHLLLQFDLRTQKEGPPEQGSQMPRADHWQQSRPVTQPGQPRARTCDQWDPNRHPGDPLTSEASRSPHNRPSLPAVSAEGSFGLSRTGEPRDRGQAPEWGRKIIAGPWALLAGGV